MSSCSSSIVARARCSALLTEATEVSSSSATSVACQRSTSRRMSTARWRGGRCCSAATKASRSVSRSAATSAGSASGESTAESAIGRTQALSTSGAPSGAPASDDGPRSIGCARRWALPSMSRHTWLAILNSHAFSAPRAASLSDAFHARTIVSCTASSASEPEPIIR